MKAFEQSECEKFGRFLHEARKKSKLTQSVVAEHCGHRQKGQFISNIERGTCWPPMNVLLTMSDLYGISRSKLLNKLVDARKKVWANQLGLSTKSKKAASK